MTAVGMSVVVPTRNRHEQLARCLRALAPAAKLLDGVEVIVVNDGGPPLEAGILDGAADGLALTFINLPRGGPAAARNAGAEAAQGLYLAFTDDDCEPAPGWLQMLERRLEADPGAVVGGKVVALHPENIWAIASQLLLDHLNRWYNRDPEHARFVTSNNLAMTAATFRALGGFHTGFPDAAAEDRELAERTLRSGRGIVYAPEAVVQHRHRLTGRTFLHQHYGYGRGAYRLLRIRRGTGGGMILEPPRFYADLLRAPLDAHRGVQRLRLGLLLAVSQAAHTAGFVREALHRQ